MEEKQNGCTSNSVTFEAKIGDRYVPMTKLCSLEEVTDEEDCQDIHGGAGMSGPVRIAIEFDANAAKLRVDEYIRELNSDPLHWPNNKRRRMGMKPLRKPLNLNTRRKRDFFYNFIMRIVEDSLREVVPKVVAEPFDTFADVSQIAKEDITEEQE